MKPVLLVDNSPTMLASMSSILKRAGFSCETAGTGEAAFDKVNGGLAPCLVITDYHMPGMHGVDLISKLRKVPSTRFTPMLVLTTNSQPRSAAPPRPPGRPAGSSSRSTRRRCCRS